MPERTPRTKSEKAEAAHQVMHEFKEGDLHSGSKEGPKVTSRDQAVAIAMSESGQARPAPGSHGYGHPAPLRSGALRNSGHAGAHRVGKRR